MGCTYTQIELPPMERNFQPIANIFIILINMTHNTDIGPSIRVIVVLYEHTFKLSEDTSE
jgi:hypothetical protein